MSKYKRQVDKNHYFSSYENVPRFVSYYHQQNILRQFIEKIGKTKKQINILEIGAGSGFLKAYIQANFSNVSYKIFDIAEDLKPDYIGDMTEIDEIVNKKFDIVCCFQVLEHVKFDDAIATISKLRNITNYLIISLPYVRLYFSARIKVSALNPLKIIFSVPFPIKHKFDGEHYWELGTRGYSLKRFRHKISKEKFKIINEFSDVMNPWHRFFVCQ